MYVQCVCCAANNCQGNENCAHSSCPFILASIAEEEVARLVDGNDNGVSKAGFAWDDAVGHDSGICEAGSLDVLRQFRRLHFVCGQVINVTARSPRCFLDSSTCPHIDVGSEKCSRRLVPNVSCVRLICFTNNMFRACCRTCILSSSSFGDVNSCA